MEKDDYEKGGGSYEPAICKTKMHSVSASGSNEFLCGDDKSMINQHITTLESIKAGIWDEETNNFYLELIISHLQKLIK